MAKQKDPARYLTGAAAIILCARFMWLHMDVFSIFIASLFLCSISISDTLYSKIPNFAVLMVIILSLLHHLQGAGLQGLAFAAEGMLLGFSLLLLPYLVGGMAAGDVKALAALGTLLGPAGIFHVFLYTALFGGMLAVLHYLMSRNFKDLATSFICKTHLYLSSKNIGSLLPAGTGEKLRFPYAAAITFGYFAHLQWGSIL